MWMSINIECILSKNTDSLLWPKTFLYYCVAFPYLPNDARDVELVWLYYEMFFYFIGILFFPPSYHILQSVAIQ